MRAAWGCVRELHNKKGIITSWQASYPSPREKGKRITKNFPAGQKAAAFLWLEKEHVLIDRDAMGIDEWTHPKIREAQQKGVTFAVFTEQWLKDYRIANGAFPVGATKRNLYADVSHLIDYFGKMRMDSIDCVLLRKWYDSEHNEGAYSFHRQCARMKKILQDAADGSVGNFGRLYEHSPWKLPMPPLPDSGREYVRPVTAEQLKILYDSMPDYDRLMVYMSAAVGGLRIGEACALRKIDVDLESLELHVEHSVNRGADDLGPAELGTVKTPKSRRVVPIPHILAPIIHEHIRNFCITGSEMLFVPRRAKILSPTTVQAQFRKARKIAGREDITFHTLRATHATMMFICGGTLRECMDDLGHCSEKIAVMHYQRIVPEHRRQTVENMAEKMFIFSRPKSDFFGETIEEKKEERFIMSENSENFVSLADCVFHAGNLTKDPDYKTFDDGNEVCYLRIACTDSDGEPVYVSADVRKRTLKWLKKQNLGKGSFVIVAGREYERYNDYKGEDETVLRVSLMSCCTSWDKTSEENIEPSAAAASDSEEKPEF